MAALLGRRLVRDEEILERLKERFRKRGREMPEVNAKQADVVEGAVVLPNRRGTAPGYLVEADGKTIVLLPGRAVGDEGDLRRERPAAPDARGDAARRPPPRPEGRRSRRERRRGARPPRLRGAPRARRHDPRGGAGRGPAPLRRPRDARGGAERSSTRSRRTSGRRSAPPSSDGTTRRSKGSSAALLRRRRPDARARGVVHRGDGRLAPHRRRRLVRVLSRRSRHLRERGEDRRSSASRRRRWRAHGAVSEEVAREMAAGVRRRFGASVGPRGHRHRGARRRNARTSRSAPSTSPSTSRTGRRGTSGSSSRATARWCGAGRRRRRWR